MTSTVVRKLRVFRKVRSQNVIYSEFNYTPDVLECFLAFRVSDTHVTHYNCAKKKNIQTTILRVYLFRE